MKKAEFELTRQVGHLLRKAVQKNQAIYSRLVVDPNMTSVQFAVLYVLESRGPSSLAVISRAAAIDAATTRDVAKRLEARGFVSMAPDESDKRKSIVSLSKTGRQMVDAMRPHSIEVAELTMGNLNPAEQVALVYLLDKLCADPAAGTDNSEG